MALKQDVVDSVLCPKQGMYLRIFCRKLGQVPNPHRLTYTQILVKYPPPPPPLQLGAETDNTILETEKASGRGETLGTIVENNNWARQKKKKTGSHLFLQFTKVISPFPVLNTPQCLYGVKITILKINTRLRSESKFR